MRPFPLLAPRDAPAVLIGCPSRPTGAIIGAAPLRHDAPFAWPYRVHRFRSKAVGPLAEGFHSTMEERGNVAALVRAAHRPKLKEYIYWFHAKTPEEQEYLRPKLERWIHKQRDGARKKRQAKRKNPSPELGADLGMSLDPAKEQEQEQAGGADLGGFDQQYYSSEPLQPDAEVVPNSQDVVADSQEEDVVEETDDESGYGYEGDEEMAEYEGTIFADTGEHGGYDPALWLWQEGEDDLPHDDLPTAAHSPSPSSRQPMGVDEHAQPRAAAGDEQEEAKDDFVRVKKEEEDVSPRPDDSTLPPAEPLPPAQPAATKPATTKPAAVVDLSDSDDSSDDDDPLAGRRLRARVVLYNKALELHYEELAREPGGAEKVAQEKAEASKGWQEGCAAMEAAWHKYRHRLRREAKELGARELGISISPSPAEEDVPVGMEVDDAGGGARPSPARSPRPSNVPSTPDKSPKSSTKAPSPLARPSHPPPPSASPAKPPAASEPLADVPPPLPPSPPRPHSAPPAAASTATALAPLKAFEPSPRPLPTPHTPAQDVKVKVEEHEGEERRKEEPAPREGAGKKKKDRAGRSAAGWRAQIERRVERRAGKSHVDMYGPRWGGEEDKRTERGRDEGRRREEERRREERERSFHRHDTRSYRRDSYHSPSPPPRRHRNSYRPYTPPHRRRTPSPPSYRYDRRRSPSPPSYRRYDSPSPSPSYHRSSHRYDRAGVRGTGRVGERGRRHDRSPTPHRSLRRSVSPSPSPSPPPRRSYRDSPPSHSHARRDTHSRHSRR